jgi:hypothetical protein
MLLLVAVVLVVVVVVVADVVAIERGTDEHIIFEQPRPLL